MNNMHHHGEHFFAIFLRVAKDDELVGFYNNCADVLGVAHITRFTDREAAEKGCHDIARRIAAR